MWLSRRETRQSSPGSGPAEGVGDREQSQLVGLMLGSCRESQPLGRERRAGKVGWSLRGRSFQLQA